MSDSEQYFSNMGYFAVAFNPIKIRPIMFFKYWINTNEAKVNAHLPATVTQLKRFVRWIRVKEPFKLLKFSKKPSCRKLII